MPAKYPNWNARKPLPPNTDKLAKPTRWRHEENVTVIEVTAASYRNSLPLNGVFEVVNPKEPTKEFKKRLRCEVYCSWFSVKPPTVYPQILLDEPGCEYKIIENYTGDVIDNLQS